MIADTRFRRTFRPRQLPWNGPLYSAESVAIRGFEKTAAVPPAKRTTSVFHRGEEFLVVLGLFQTVQKEFHGLDRIHFRQELAKDPYLV